jgi:hypothetical protein
LAAKVDPAVGEAKARAEETEVETQCARMTERPETVERAVPAETVARAEPAVLEEMEVQFSMVER